MTKVLEWADREGIAWRGMLPVEFFVTVSDRLGVELSPFIDPEDAAAAWLEAIVKLDAADDGDSVH